MLGMPPLYGYNIVESPLMEKWRWTGPVVLRESCPCSDAMRESFNDWAIALFGGEKKSHVLVSEKNRMIFMHPALGLMLRKESVVKMSSIA